MPDWMMYVFFGLGLVSMIGSFWTIATAGSSADAYAELTSTITAILVANLVFTILFTLGIYMYRIRKGDTQITQIFISGITMFLSITAISLAALQKSA